MCALVLIINVHTKSEMPTFTHSKDMIWTHKFKIGHVTLTAPLSQVVRRPLVIRRYESRRKVYGHIRRFG